jgi:1-acyl-sn-glycerol-3-phosphate acyltransferase
LSSQFTLLSQRRFAPFFWTQFLGAANDNIFKVAFTVLVTYKAAQWGNIPPSQAAFLIGAIFILPFVFLSATSGQLADKYEKGKIMRFVKSFEIAIMVLAAVGFIYKQPYVLYACVFFMGLHSTLFGPVKFAYLPQHLGDKELTGGNGLVEMGTFVAILIGSIVGTTLGGMGDNGLIIIAVIGLVVAAAGRVCAGFIPNTPASAPDLVINWNPISETWRNLKIAKGNRTVFLSLLGISWLWFVGAIFLTSFTPYAKDTIGGNESVVTVLLATFSIGIAIGSMLCEKLSGPKVEIGLVPFGSIGMSLFAVDLYFASQGLGANNTGASGIGAAAFVTDSRHWRVLFDLFGLAMFSGFYSVPLYALIQSRCEPAYRARIVGANNILNALFMITASVLAGALLAAKFTIPQLFLVTALLNAVVAIYIYTLVPEFLMRFMTWILLNTVYRVQPKGLDNIPDEGAALLVCNHVSFADAVIIGGTVRRPIRFVMDHRIFKVPVLNFIFRTAKAIPIAPRKEDPQMLERAYVEVQKALANGDIVCIFPEGKITDNGEINPFREGVLKILESSPVPVVPLALQGMWGSFFSRVENRSAMTSPFRRGFLNKIGLVAGQPVRPNDVTAEGLQQRVLALRGDWR